MSKPIERLSRGKLICELAKRLEGTNNYAVDQSDTPGNIKGHVLIDVNDSQVQEVYAGFGNPQDSINQDEAAGQNYDSHIERGSDLSVQHDIAENVDYEAEIFNQSQILASCGTDGEIHYNDNIEDTSNLLDSSIMEYEMISNWQDENSVIANTSCNEDDISSATANPDRGSDDINDTMQTDIIEDISAPSSSKEDQQVNDNDEIRTALDNDFDNGLITTNESFTEKKGRKRTRNEDNWQRNALKKMRNTGATYTNRKGKVIGKKTPISHCTNEKCQRDCSKISSVQQDEINSEFWKLGDITRQREFIVNNLSLVEPEYRYVKEGSNRSNNFAFYFKFDELKIRVCKKMFMNTLNISHKFITTAWKKKKNVGVLEGDLRGKHSSHKAVPEQIKNDVAAHINSFSRMESHYCRARSKKEYLDGSLNISIMYRMYVEKCKESGKEFCKQHLYEQIFNSNFNISFHQPKKDLCSLCISYNNCPQEEKNSMETKYRKHIHEKSLSREQKSRDVESAKENEAIGVYCFDLQAVLNSPCGECSEFYYKRKLSCYNLTAFDVVNKEGHCFFWHEKIAKRGSNEIGSSILIFLRSVMKEKVVLYSDNCFGQNKNKYFACMLLHVVATSETINSITHNFLITGHTQNENDSMHATIEREKKRVLRGGSITVPTQWVTVLKSAKKSGKPYNVRELDTSDILDLKFLADELGKNFTVNDDKEKVSWAEIKIIEVRKTDPFKIFYKTSYEEQNFKVINIRGKLRGRPSTAGEIVLKPAYNLPIKIDEAKKKDLLSLCENNLIPRVHWDFYKNL